MSRPLTIIATALVTAGLVLLADAGLTLIWKEPVSAIAASLGQDRAEDELRELEAEFDDDSGLSFDDEPEVGDRAAELAGRFEDELETGRGIARIRIPAIEADYVLVEGVDASSLQRGPGRYPETALPGQGRTVAIAGHRTTYLAPFNEIDKLEPRDEVIVEMPYATFTYRVAGSRIVSPLETHVIGDVDFERLVLTACHPLYSDAERYVVFARLKRIRLDD